MEDIDPSKRKLNKRLPRLARHHYQGLAMVHWTHSIHQRKIGWLNDLFHARFRECMLHAQIRQEIFCPVYCLMPDHIHAVWMGTEEESDQIIGTKFLRTYLTPVLLPVQLQHQPYDNVLRASDRAQDAFQRLCGYVLENPVRAELVQTANDWPYSGCLVPGFPDLCPFQEEYWELFWRLYYRKIDPRLIKY